MTRNAAPIGSKWTIGFSVSRPNSFAVPSPSRYAARAWENSWTGNDTRRMSAIAMINSGDMSTCTRDSDGERESQSYRGPMSRRGPRPTGRRPTGRRPTGSPVLQAAEQLGLLRLELLGGDRAAVAEVGEPVEGRRDLVCGHGRRSRGDRRRLWRLGHRLDERRRPQRGRRHVAHVHLEVVLLVEHLLLEARRLVQPLVAIDRLLVRGHDVEVAEPEHPSPDALVEDGVVDLLERAVGRVLVEYPIDLQHAMVCHHVVLGRP